MAIEVKAGAAGKIRSLHQWMKDISYKKKMCPIQSLQRLNRDDQYQFENVNLKYPLVTLPLYMVQNLDRFL